MVPEGPLRSPPVAGGGRAGRGARVSGRKARGPSPSSLLHWSPELSPRIVPLGRSYLLARELIGTTQRLPSERAPRRVARGALKEGGGRGAASHRVHCQGPNYRSLLDDALRSHRVPLRRRVGSSPQKSVLPEEDARFSGIARPAVLPGSMRACRMWAHWLVHSAQQGSLLRPFVNTHPDSHVGAREVVGAAEVEPGDLLDSPSR